MGHSNKNAFACVPACVCFMAGHLCSHPNSSMGLKDRRQGERRKVKETVLQFLLAHNKRRRDERMKGMRGRQIEGQRREGCTRAEEVNEKRGGGRQAA